MSDLLSLAILAKFFADTAPLLDPATFILAAIGLAAAAGLGGGRVLRKPLSVAALIVWLLRESSLRTDFLLAYGGLLASLALAYALGRFLRSSAWALAAATVMALVGLAMLGSAASHL